MVGDQVNDAPQLTAVYSITSSDLYIQVCERSGRIGLHRAAWKRDACREAEQRHPDTKRWFWNLSPEPWKTDLPGGSEGTQARLSVRGFQARTRHA